MNKKILKLSSLEKIIFRLKSKKKKIVLCHGVFDLLHVGHIKHFEEAKKQGDILIVSITTDKFVIKGPNRPAFNEKLRADALAALQAIDYVVVSNFSTATAILQKIKPNIYCKGNEYKNFKNDTTGEIKNENKVLKKFGGKIFFTSGITFSSSNLLNKFSDESSKTQKKLMRIIKKKHSFEEIKSNFENFKKLKVLVIGELIIDQYFFCEAIGKSGKEAILVLKENNNEKYIGGAGAICRHLSQFCKKISLVTMLGEKAEELREIKKGFTKNININFIKKKNSPTIIKKRFIDYINSKKVIGVDVLNDDPLEKKNEMELKRIINKEIPKHDVVIVSDYGHGLISKNNAKLICKKSKNLFLNAQINSANVGYHSILNYMNFKCLVINEKELRHELRNKSEKVESLMKKLSIKHKIMYLVVSRGNQGAILYNKFNNKFYYSEAFAKNIQDKVGAGDALLSLLSLCLASKLPNELSLFSGSLAAAQSVETIGNKESINKTKILKFIEHILK